MTTRTASAPEIAPAANIAVQEAIEFIWVEADLLDRRAYREWLDLWDETGLYIIPIERDAADYAAHLNVAYDDAEMRQARVKRLSSGFSMSARASARTVRTVSRFVVDERGENWIALRCAQHLAEYKNDRVLVHAADVDYRLTRADGALRIARKVIRMINSDDAFVGVGYLF
ncbi:MAG: hypothetical protein DI605_03755 [Sphingomonas sp.]|nr:MAG: hypothetical protein DI605_03755 [Sphingomonas sp.]